MIIHQYSDTDIAISRLHEAGFDIQAEDPAAHFGGVCLLVTSLAWCTYSVLASYAQRIDVPVEDMTMRLKWRLAQKPTRIAAIDMQVRWPQLPESRLDAAMRAAALCTVHNTLKDSVEIETLIEN